VQSTEFKFVIFYMTFRRRCKILIGESTLVCHSEFAEVVFDLAHVPQTRPGSAECLPVIVRVQGWLWPYCLFFVHSQGVVTNDGKIVVPRSNSQEVAGNP